MQPSSWKLGAWKLWAAAGLSAGLLELPFPLAGPLPVWRTVFAWFGLVPLLWAILSPACADGPRPLRRGFLLAYLCGFLWYMGNCYWVRDTMSHYGDMPPLAPTLLLLGYSMVLGLYFGLFGLCVAAGAQGHGQHAPGAGRCAVSLGRAGAGRRAHHQRSLGPTGLLAGGQRAAEPARAMDRGLRDQLCAGGSECAACRSGCSMDRCPQTAGQVEARLWGLAGIVLLVVRNGVAC